MSRKNSKGSREMGTTVGSLVGKVTITDIGNIDGYSREGPGVDYSREETREGLLTAGRRDSEEEYSREMSGKDCLQQAGDGKRITAGRGQGEDCLQETEA